MTDKNDRTAVIEAMEKEIERVRQACYDAEISCDSVIGWASAYAAALRKESGETHNVKCPECDIIFDAQWEEKEAAYRAAHPKAEEGMVLVPKEPTRDMHIAGIDAYNAAEYDGVKSIYRAMLAAAPSSKATGGERK